MMSKPIVFLMLFLILAVAAYLCYKEGERAGYSDGYDDAIDDVMDLLTDEERKANNDL